MINQWVERHSGFRFFWCSESLRIAGPFGVSPNSVPKSAGATELTELRRRDGN